MVIYAVNYFFNVLIYLLLIRAIMSWVVRDYQHPFVRIVHQLTDPLLAPMQTLFARMGWMRSGIDFSFLATFVMLQVINNLVIRILINAGL